MSERPLTSDELTRLLEGLRLQDAGVSSTSEAAQAQLDLLLARIQSLTDALRAAEPTETARLASRMLLGDLAVVAAQFRGRSNEIAESLTRALEDIRVALDDADRSGRAR